MKKIHYAWLICAGSTLLLFCTAGLTTSAFSIYQPYLIEAGGLTNAQGSTVITIRSLLAFISMFFVGKVHHKLDMRVSVVMSSLIAAVAFVLYGINHSFIGYCFAAALAGIAYGIGGMIAVSVIIGRWFHSHRGLALGICSAGTGAATIVVPPIVSTIIEKFSLSAAFIAEGIFILICTVVVFFIIKNRPQDIGLHALGDSDDIVNAPLPGGKHNLPRRAFIIMCLSMFLIGTIGNTGFAHLSVLYKTAGFDAAYVSFLLSFVGIALTSGKFIYGWITDLLGSYKSNFVTFTLLTTGVVLACFAFTKSHATAIISMLLIGIGLPISTMGIPIVAGDMSTPERYANTTRIFQMSYMAGALVFGIVPGILADITGSYVPTFILLSIFTATSVIIIQLTYHKHVNPHK